MQKIRGNITWHTSRERSSFCGPPGVYIRSRRLRVLRKGICMFGVVDQFSLLSGAGFSLPGDLWAILISFLTLNCLCLHWKKGCRSTRYRGLYPKGSVLIAPLLLWPNDWHKQRWGGIIYLGLGFRRLSPPITWPHVLVHNTMELATVQRKVLQEKKECQHLTGFLLFFSNSVWTLSPGMVSPTFRVALPISPVNIWKISHRPPEERYSHLLDDSKANQINNEDLSAQARRPIIGICSYDFYVHLHPGWYVFRKTSKNEEGACPGLTLIWHHSP